MRPSSSGALPGDKAAIAAQISADLARLIALRSQIKANPADAADRRLLRAWQSARLAESYADLMADARYRPAAQFFLEDLYGAHDPSRRDADMAQVVPMFARMLPAGALKMVAVAVQLDALSEELDRALVLTLREHHGAAVLANLAEADYADSFRAAGTRADRERQIALIGEIGLALDRLTRLPAIGAALRLMRRPASMMGFSELHDFLDRGFRAFRHMGECTRFLATIRTRETAILVRVYAGDPHPFSERPAGR